jgi:hypothetical protein
VRFAPWPNFVWVVSSWAGVRSATRMAVMMSLGPVRSELYTMVQAVCCVIFGLMLLWRVLSSDVMSWACGNLKD